MSRAERRAAVGRGLRKRGIESAGGGSQKFLFRNVERNVLSRANNAPSPPHPANKGRAHRAGGAPCASCGAVIHAGRETRARPLCMSTRGAGIALGCPPCPPSSTCHPAADFWGPTRPRRARPQAGVHPATRRVTTPVAPTSWSLEPARKRARSDSQKGAGRSSVAGLNHCFSSKSARCTWGRVSLKARASQLR